MEGGVEPPHSRTPDRIRSAYETAKAALLAEMMSNPVAADDPVQKLLDAPVTEFRHWIGELSTSALSTATAIMALEQMRRQYVTTNREVPNEWLSLIRGGIDWLIAHQNEDGGWGDTVKSISNISTTMLCRATLHAVQSRPLVPREESRAPTEVANGTYTSNAASNVDGATAFVSRNETATLAQAYIDRTGGVPALIARYGKDHTFSVPILTHCALAGLVGWSEVMSLPFELACIPAKFYAAVRLPVVSYALPALIAIGQVRFHFRPSRNPLRRWLQRWAKSASLRVLERIQPTNGGFLEATPLTSFVTMSLAAMGLIDHPVTRRGIEFIVASARWNNHDSRHRACPGGSTASALLRDARPEDSTSTSAKAVKPLGQAQGRDDSPLASWPIDTNLATWVTTLAINALGDDVPPEARPGLRAWLLRQQYRVVHPYTQAAPGGWSWTDLPGGVPDGDDTPGAMLALMNLERSEPPARTGEPGGVSPRTSDEHVRGLTPSGSPNVTDRRERVSNGNSLVAATNWLLALQNRDGGWPTFCRGWGALPFDRSSPDISAHVIRNLETWLRRQLGFGWKKIGLVRLRLTKNAGPVFPVWRAIGRGLKFLKRTQHPDGSWLPLWFGNQHAPNDENPTYGTAKVLAAFQALGRMSDRSAVRGVRWLVENQNPDGGWGAGHGTPSSIEETALALEALVGQCSPHVPREDQPNADTASDSNRTTISPSTRQGGSAFPHAEREGYIEATVSAGLSWLIPRVEDGRFREPSPIGFYFAKLWYFEALYPLIFTVAALRKAVEATRDGFEPVDP